MAGPWSRVEDTASPSACAHSRGGNCSWVIRTLEPESWVRRTQEGRVDAALKIQAGVQKLGLRANDVGK